MTARSPWRRLIGVAVLVVVGMGCSPTNTGRETADATEGAPPVVAPPADLAAMEADVQAHFERVWQRHQAAVEAGTPAAEAQSWGDLGGWYHLYGYLAPAATCYQRAMALDATEPRWPYFLAHVHRLAGRLQAAHDGFRNVVDMAPDNERALVWQAEMARALDDLDAARTLYDAVLARTPNHALARAGRGEIALQRGALDAAEADFTAALTAQPTTPQLIYGLSRVATARGNDDRARSLLAQIPPDNRAHKRIRLADPWMEALEATREGVLVHLGKGRDSRAAGRPREALGHYQRAVAADPDHPEARLFLATTLAETGRLGLAIRELEAAVTQMPKEARLRARLGALVAARGDLARGEAEVEAALGLDPESPDARLVLGQIQQRAGRPSEALEAFRAVRAAEPSEVRAVVGEVECLLALDRRAEATATAQSALRSLPTARALRALMAREGLPAAPPGR